MTLESRPTPVRQIDPPPLVYNDPAPVLLQPIVPSPPQPWNMSLAEWQTNNYLRMLVYTKVCLQNEGTDPTGNVDLHDQINSGVWIVHHLFSIKAFSTKDALFHLEELYEFGVLASSHPAYLTNRLAHVAKHRCVTGIEVLRLIRENEGLTSLHPLDAISPVEGTISQWKLDDLTVMSLPTLESLRDIVIDPTGRESLSQIITDGVQAISRFYELGCVTNKQELTYLKEIYSLALIIVCSYKYRCQNPDGAWLRNKFAAGLVYTDLKALGLENCWLPLNLRALGLKT